MRKFSIRLACLCCLVALGAAAARAEEAAAAADVQTATDKGVAFLKQAQARRQGRL